MPPLATAESSVEERYAAWQRQKHPPTGDLARPAPPAEIDAQIKQSAQEFGVDPSLMTSLFYHESGFDPTAKSEAGAQGIAQFMPEMSKAAGIDPLIPSQAIPAATKHVAYLQKKYGNEDAALAAYSLGEPKYDKGVRDPDYVTAVKKGRNAYWLAGAADRFKAYTVAKQAKVGEEERLTAEAEASAEQARDAQLDIGGKKSVAVEIKPEEEADAIGAAERAMGAPMVPVTGEQLKRVAAIAGKLFYSMSGLELSEQTLGPLLRPDPQKYQQALAQLTPDERAFAAEQGMLYGPQVLQSEQLNAAFGGAMIALGYHLPLHIKPIGGIDSPAALGLLDMPKIDIVTGLLGDHNLKTLSDPQYDIMPIGEIRAADARGAEIIHSIQTRNVREATLRERLDRTVRSVRQEDLEAVFAPENTIPLQDVIPDQRLAFEEAKTIEEYLLENVRTSPMGRTLLLRDLTEGRTKLDALVVPPTDELYLAQEKGRILLPKELIEQARNFEIAAAKGSAGEGAAYRSMAQHYRDVAFRKAVPESLAKSNPILYADLRRRVFGVERPIAALPEPISKGKVLSYDETAPEMPTQAQVAQKRAAPHPRANPPTVNEQALVDSIRDGILRDIKRPTKTQKAEADVTAKRLIDLNRGTPELDVIIKKFSTLEESPNTPIMAVETPRSVGGIAPQELPAIEARAAQIMESGVTADKAQKRAKVEVMVAAEGKRLKDLTQQRDKLMQQIQELEAQRPKKKGAGAGQQIDQQAQQIAQQLEKLDAESQHAPIRVNDPDSLAPMQLTPAMQRTEQILKDGAALTGLAEIRGQISRRSFRLYRIEEKGQEISFDKPHGTYFNIEYPGFKSPYEGFFEAMKSSGKGYRATAEPKNPLILDKPNPLGYDAGVQALENIVTPKEFERLRSIGEVDFSHKMSRAARGTEAGKQKLIEEVKRIEPDLDTSKYFDSYEILGAIGARKAKVKGHDAIVSVDREHPDFSEYVTLVKNIKELTQAVQDAPFRVFFIDPKDESLGVRVNDLRNGTYQDFSTVQDASAWLMDKGFNPHDVYSEALDRLFRGQAQTRQEQLFGETPPEEFTGAGAARVVGRRPPVKPVRTEPAGETRVKKADYGTREVEYKAAIQEASRVLREEVSGPVPPMPEKPFDAGPFAEFQALRPFLDPYGIPQVSDKAVSNFVSGMAEMRAGVYAELNKLDLNIPLAKRLSKDAKWKSQEFAEAAKILDGGSVTDLEPRLRPLGQAITNLLQEIADRQDIQVKDLLENYFPRQAEPVNMIHVDRVIGDRMKFEELSPRDKQAFLRIREMSTRLELPMEAAAEVYEAVHLRAGSNRQTLNPRWTPFDAAVDAGLRDPHLIERTGAIPRAEKYKALLARVYWANRKIHFDPALEQTYILMQRLPDATQRLVMKVWERTMGIPTDRQVILRNWIRKTVPQITGGRFSATGKEAEQFAGLLYRQTAYNLIGLNPAAVVKHAMADNFNIMAQLGVRWFIEGRRLSSLPKWRKFADTYMGTGKIRELPFGELPADVREIAMKDMGGGAMGDALSKILFGAYTHVDHANQITAAVAGYRKALHFGDSLPEVKHWMRTQGHSLEEAAKLYGEMSRLRSVMKITPWDVPVFFQSTLGRMLGQFQVKKLQSVQMRMHAFSDAFRHGNIGPLARYIVSGLMLTGMPFDEDLKVAPLARKGERALGRAVSFATGMDIKRIPVYNLANEAGHGLETLMDHILGLGMVPGVQKTPRAFKDALRRGTYNLPPGVPAVAGMLAKGGGMLLDTASSVARGYYQPGDWKRIILNLYEGMGPAGSVLRKGEVLKQELETGQEWDAKRGMPLAPVSVLDAMGKAALSTSERREQATALRNIGEDYRSATHDKINKIAQNIMQFRNGEIDQPTLKTRQMSIFKDGRPNPSQRSLEMLAGHMNQTETLRLYMQTPKGARGDFIRKMNEQRGYFEGEE